MTLLGVIFIPIIIFCFLLRPFYLLPLLIVASVFEAGSAFNGQYGNFEFGISPFYLVEICIFMRLLLNLMGSLKFRDMLPKPSTAIGKPTWFLVSFWLWGLFSAFIMPHLFAGTPVSVPRTGGEGEFAPLQWNLSNMAQAVYLTLNVGAVIYALHMVKAPRQVNVLLRGLYLAVAIVIVIGLAQFIAARTGFDFPYETLNNNPGYAQGYDQDLGVGLLRRINSTFLEPSMAGSFLAAIGCGLLASFLRGRRSIGWLFSLFAVIMMLLLTTSSTGYVSMAIGVLMIAVYLNPLRNREHGLKTSRITWILIFSVFFILALVVYWTPDLLDAVISSTVEKGESISFWLRLANEIHSLQLVWQTYGVGVGLGSNRSSGLLPTMLSSVGMLGTFLFTAMLYAIRGAYPGKKASSSLQLGFWTLVTMVISEIVAVPDINRPVMWAFFVIVFVQLSVHYSDASNVRLPALRPSISPRSLSPVSVVTTNG